VFGFSEKKHYKKPGAKFPRTTDTSGDDIEFDTLIEEKIPKLTPKLKQQLKRESRWHFCRNVGHIRKTCPKKAALLVKQKAEKRGSFASDSYFHFSFCSTTGGSVTSVTSTITRSP